MAPLHQVHASIVDEDLTGYVLSGNKEETCLSNLFWNSNAA